MSLKGIEYLRAKLQQKAKRVKTRYEFYEQKNITLDFMISTPPQLRWFEPVIGWCAKSVDSIADRLTFRGFENDSFNFEEIFAMNNPDVLFDSAILSALIAACSFVYVSADKSGFPRLQVIDGGNATGELDPLTGMLTEGYAALDRDGHGSPTLEAYFVPYCTTFVYADGHIENIENDSPYPLLVPIIYRPDAKRPFGHSRISRACMDIQSSAIRTIKRSEISAEFFSFPQKYITGLSEDVEIADKWKAAMSSILALYKDEDGEKPVVGQFLQQSMSPHIEQLRMFASLFGAESGLTLDDLGFASGNPSSADAIKAAHENLRLSARKAQKTFGSGFLNVGLVAACIRDGVDYERKKVYQTEPTWYPVFEADGASMGALGDAIIKINQASDGYFDARKIEQLIGV